MSRLSNKVSEYIDSLNLEKEPCEHGDPNAQASAEFDKIAGTVRMIRSIREPALPGKDYAVELSDGVIRRLNGTEALHGHEKAEEIKSDRSGSTFGQKTHGQADKGPVRKQKRLWVAVASTAAVLMLVMTIFSFLPKLGGTDTVYAMEQAYKGIHAYHGIVAFSDINENGEETSQWEIEVWADRDGRYFMKQLNNTGNEVLTTNNGREKWQIIPEQKQVYLFSAFPDAYRFTFELGKEIEDVRNAADIKAAGEDKVAGRAADILEITPKGGVPYRLWIDRETRLPLQKESGVQNGLQYRVTYKQIDFSGEIPAGLMTYNPPAGFKVSDTDPEQIVNDIGEAAALAGFEPKLPGNIPEGYRLEYIAITDSAKTVKYSYITSSANIVRRVVILQGKAAGGLKPGTAAALGKVNGQTAEVQSPLGLETGILSGGGAYTGITGITSVRWQENGCEYAVLGDATLEDLTLFIEGLSVGKFEKPDAGLGQNDKDFKPVVDVTYDKETEENDQRSVDAGNQPWKLDPVFVTQVFVSLKISPEGITGDYPVQYESFFVTSNSGTAAIVDVEDSKSPVAKVYLKKVVRQDQTGIWTVVGYDPAKRSADSEK